MAIVFQIGFCQQGPINLTGFSFGFLKLSTLNQQKKMRCDENDIFLHLINVFSFITTIFLISLRKILKIKGNVTIVTFFGPFHVSRF